MWNERGVTRIGIGIVGGGYMGKAHAVAMSAVAAVFDTALRPSLEMICTTTPEGAADKARQFVDALVQENAPAPEGGDIDPFA